MIPQGWFLVPESQRVIRRRRPERWLTLAMLCLLSALFVLGWLL